MPISTIKDIWKAAWNSPIKRPRLIAILVLIPTLIITLPYFFNYIEKRDGVVLNDWVLAQVPVHNVSPLIFATIWGMVLLVLYRSLYKPSILINYCLTLAVVTVARITCISLFPLSPPVGFIPLVDPLSGVFYGEATITKDLFFSGHTATVVTIFFCLEKRNDKIIAFLSVIAIAVLLVIQHIHYTIDILGAPVIVYVMYRFTRHILYQRNLYKRNLYKRKRKSKNIQKEKRVLLKVYAEN